MWEKCRLKRKLLVQFQVNVSSNVGIEIPFTTAATNLLFPSIERSITLCCPSRWNFRDRQWSCNRFLSIYSHISWFGSYQRILRVFIHLSQRPQDNHNVSTTIAAVSLAAYSYAFKYPKLLKKVNQLFVYAPHLVNTSLSSIEDATQDSTVVFVVLFDTFGVLTCQKLHTLMDCDRHICDATKMIILRGFRQMETHHGLQLFLQINSILL